MINATTVYPTLALVTTFSYVSLLVKLGNCSGYARIAAIHPYTLITSTVRDQSIRRIDARSLG
jgi:hypothetical protein